MILCKCEKPYVEMIAVEARYNPFAEHAGMTRVCESKPDKSILDAVAELEKIGFTPYWMAVPEINKQILEGRVQIVKEILRNFGYPYNRRIAGQPRHFTTKDHRKWLYQAEEDELANVLCRLAQLNQAKIYIFWKKNQSLNLSRFASR